MIKALFDGLVAGLLQQDTEQVLQILEDNQGCLQEPLEGPSIHAKILYYALKQANQLVIHYLINLGIHSDLCFYHYCGDTPLGLAFALGLKELLPSLLLKTDKSFALLTAVKLKNKALTQYLLGHSRFSQRLLSYLGLTK